MSRGSLGAASEREAQHGELFTMGDFPLAPLQNNQREHTLKAGPDGSQLGGCFKLQLSVFDVNTGRHAKTY